MKRSMIHERERERERERVGRSTSCPILATWTDLLISMPAVHIQYLVQDTKSSTSRQKRKFSEGNSLPYQDLNPDTLSGRLGGRTLSNM